MITGFIHRHKNILPFEFNRVINENKKIKNLCTNFVRKSLDNVFISE